MGTTGMISSVRNLKSSFRFNNSHIFRNGAVSTCGDSNRVRMGFAQVVREAVLKEKGVRDIK